MERIKSLGRYQKILLLLGFIMLLVFTVIYSITIKKEGFAYRDAILIPKQENESTIYYGKIQGKYASFTVSPEKVINFQYGDKVYGPYTVKEDVTAIPKDSDMRESMTGIELYCGEELIFRGGVENLGDFFWIYNEDGSFADTGACMTTYGEMVMDESGDGIGAIEPSVSTIMELINGPKLTHKGTWMGWLCGVVVCIMTIISILFADELFRWNLAFKIQNVDRVEPSDWEITSRYIGWTGLTILTLIVFCMGLQ